MLPGRTDNAIKNRYYSTMRRLRRQKNNGKVTLDSIFLPSFLLGDIGGHSGDNSGDICYKNNNNINTGGADAEKHLLSLLAQAQMQETNASAGQSTNMKYSISNSSSNWKTSTTSSKKRVLAEEENANYEIEALVTSLCNLKNDESCKKKKLN